MNDYWTILGNVAGAIFSPMLAMLATVVLLVTAFIWACFSGSQEAAFPLWATVVSWSAFVAVLPAGVALLIFLVRFQPFAWAVLS